MAVPVRPRDIVRYRNVAGPAWSARKKCPSPSPRPPLPFFGTSSWGIRGPPIGRVSRRREESKRSRQVTRNWLVAREFPARKKRREEGRRRYGDADGFMLNGLDSGMRALDGLPSPRFPFPAQEDRAPARSSRLLGTGSSVNPGRLPAKVPVALIAFSKSRLIDEFRRRVARK